MIREGHEASHSRSPQVRDRALKGTYISHNQSTKPELFSHFSTLPFWTRWEVKRPGREALYPLTSESGVPVANTLHKGDDDDDDDDDDKI